MATDSGFFIKYFFYLPQNIYRLKFLKNVENRVGMGKEIPREFVVNQKLNLFTCPTVTFDNSPKSM